MVRSRIDVLFVDSQFYETGLLFRGQVTHNETQANRVAHRCLRLTKKMKMPERWPSTLSSEASFEFSS